MHIRMGEIEAYTEATPDHALKSSHAYSVISFL